MADLLHLVRRAPGLGVLGNSPGHLPAPRRDHHRRPHAQLLVAHERAGAGRTGQLGAAPPPGPHLARLRGRDRAAGRCQLGRIAASALPGLWFGKPALLLFHDWVGTIWNFAGTLAGFLLLVALTLPTAERAEQDRSGRHTARRPRGWGRSGLGYRVPALDSSQRPQRRTITSLAMRYLLAAPGAAGPGPAPGGRTHRLPHRPPLRRAAGGGGRRAGPSRPRCPHRLAARRGHLRDRDRGARRPGPGRGHPAVGAGVDPPGSPRCGCGPAAG